MACCWNLRNAIPRLPEISTETFLPSDSSSLSRRCRQPEHARVVPAAEAAVGGQDQQDDIFFRLVFLQQRMLDFHDGSERSATISEIFLV